MTLARKTLALLSALTLSTFALSAFALAEGTRTWEQSKFEELTKGTANGIALRSEGGLELAPAFKALATTPSTYIWSIASDSAGNIYAAAGSPARVYRITPDGQSTAIFEPQELQVQALVVDKTAPSTPRPHPTARLYRLESAKGGKAASKPDAKTSWTSTPYFDPGSSTSGISFSTMLAPCMSPPAITAKSTKSAPTASTRFSSRAMKFTFACSHSIPRET